MLHEIVPIMGIFMIIAIVVGPIWIRSYFSARDRKELHETLRVAYEKGTPVPPELIESLQNKVGSVPTTAEGDLRRAVVLIAVGLGLVGLGYGMGWGLTYASETAGGIVGGIIAGSGAIPGLIGIAYLMLWLFRRNPSGATKV